MRILKKTIFAVIGGLFSLAIVLAVSSIFAPKFSSQISTLSKDSDSPYSKNAVVLGASTSANKLITCAVGQIFIQGQNNVWLCGDLPITKYGNAITFDGETVNINFASANSDGILSKQDYAYIFSMLSSANSNQLRTDCSVNQTLKYNGVGWICGNDNVGSNTANSISIAASQPLSYNSSNGSLTIKQANSSNDGYLSANDWNLFNTKQGNVTATNGLTKNANSISLGGTLTSNVLINTGNNNFLLSGNGNLGIGTVNPAGNLDVNNSFYTSTGSINIRAQDALLSGGQISLAGAGTNRYFKVDDYQGTLRFVSQDTVGESPKATILNNGNFGINTSNPNYNLDINGTTRTNSIIISSGASNGYILTSDANGLATWQNSIIFGLPSGSLGQTLRHNGTNFVSDSLLYNNGTNIGINTINPQSKLDVNGTIQSVNFKLTSGATNGYILASDANGLATWQNPSVFGTLPSATNGQTIRYNGATWVSSSLIYNDGSNVGINKTNPIYTLDVAGTIRVNSFIMQTGSASGYVLTSDGSGVGTWQSVTSFGLPSATAGQTLRYDGTNWVSNSVIYNDGTNIGIGTNSPSSKFDVNGTITTSALKIPTGSSIGYVLTSDSSGNATWQTAPSGTLPGGTNGQTIRNNGSGYVTSSFLFNTGSRVGINTTTPGAELDVNGSSIVQGSSYIGDLAGGNYFKLWVPSGAYPEVDFFTGGTRKTVFGYAGGGLNRSVFYNDILAQGVYLFDSSGVAIGQDTSTYANNAFFVEQQNNKVYTRSTINFGVGTNTPGSKLDVNGTTTTVGLKITTSPTSGYVLTSDSSGNATWQAPFVGGGLLPFATTGQTIYYDGTGWVATSVLYNSGSRIGIKTSSPQQDLSVNGGANIDQADLNNGNLVSGLTFGNGSTEGIASKRTAGGNQYGLDIFTNNTKRLSFTNGGNLGINNAAPSYTLDLNGNFRLQPQLAAPTGSDGAMYFDSVAGRFKCFETTVWKNCISSGVAGNVVDGTAYGQTPYWNGSIWNYNTNIYNDVNNSRVGIATTSPGYNLEVNGNSKISDLFVGDTANGNYFRFFTAGTAPEVDFKVGNNRRAVFGYDPNVARSIFYNDLHAGGMFIFDNSGIALGRDPSTYSGNALMIEQQNNKIYTNPSVSVGIGTSTPTAGYLLEVNGKIKATGFNGSCYTGALPGSNLSCNQDVAEVYDTAQPMQQGDIVSISTTKDQQVTKSSMAGDTKLMGIVSTTAGLIFNQGDTQLSGNTESYLTPTKAPVALSGKVTVKVSTKNGKISRGDAITSSPIAGYGQKATDNGFIVGKALEDFDPTDANFDTKKLIACGVGIPSTLTCAKIMIFINLTYYQPNSIISSVISDSTTDLTAKSLTVNKIIVGNNAVVISQNGDVTIAGALIASGISTLNTVKANTITTTNLITQNITVGDDSAGEITLTQNLQEITVTFSKQKSNDKYIVSLTPYSDIAGSYYISSRTVNGFTIKLNSVQNQDVTFGWTVVGK